MLLPPTGATKPVAAVVLPSSAAREPQIGAPTTMPPKTAEVIRDSYTRMARLLAAVREPLLEDSQSLFGTSCIRVYLLALWEGGGGWREVDVGHSRWITAKVTHSNKFSLRRPKSELQSWAWDFMESWGCWAARSGNFGAVDIMGLGLFRVCQRRELALIELKNLHM